MGERFEILNILVEVLVHGIGQGSTRPSRQYFKKHSKAFFRWLVWHIKMPTVCDISASNVIGLIKIDFNDLAN